LTAAYSWLLFLHLASLAAFLFAHGLAIGTRARRLFVGAYASLAVTVITGVALAFAGSWWREGWPWASLAVLAAMLAGGGGLRRRRAAIATIGAVGLLALLFLMLAKPF
jgi:hypothetical protein